MRLLSTMIATALCVAACEDVEPAGPVGPAPDVAPDVSESGDADTADALPDGLDVPEDIPPHPAEEGTVPGTFTVRPGVEIVTVFGGRPGAPYTLYDAEGERLLSVIADPDGQAHFAYIPFTHETINPADPLDPLAGITGDFVRRAETLPAGPGYLIRDDSASPPEASAPFAVLAISDVAPDAHYDGQLLDGVSYGILGHGEPPDRGMNYIEMRDGVRLSAMVRLPDPAFWGDGPYPTVIEYSGYAPSRPDRPDPGSRIATLLGYASVGVNMRGTGCSGGVFDIFSPAQHADAYDIIEVVARQPWVLHGHVGMVGLSYPGISQVHAAATRPPSLAAITPLSILSDPWEQLRPGGIYNDGFTRQWLDERDREAAPNGQSWTERRIAGGDETCAAHQVLRRQNLEFESIFRALEFYPDSAYPRSVKRLASQIDVPVYLSGAFHDEQTGAQFADILNRFDGAPVAKFLLSNGRHPDGYSPLALARWWEFLELYVALRVPRMPDWMRNLGAAEFSREYGAEGLVFEDDRFADFADYDYAGVRAAYEAEPDVRVLLESGGGLEQPGAPEARMAFSLPRWPAPDARTDTLHLLADGALGESAPSEAAALTWSHDPAAGSRTFFGPRGYQTMARLWDIDWTRFPEGAELTFDTAPLEAPMILGGPGYVELWIESEDRDVHVQVTLSELRPDGMEMLIQTGWLRAGHGTLDEEFTDGNALHYTWREEDFAPPEPGTPSLVRVPLPSVGHVLRAGSALRLAISSPGRNHGTWQFEQPEGSAGDKTLHLGPETPASLILTRLDGTPNEALFEIPEALPACPGTRGQPCRALPE